MARIELRKECAGDQREVSEALRIAAAGAGVSLAEYVKSLVVTIPRQSPSNSWDVLEKEFVELSVEGSLPTGFSRVDIYSDHD